MTRIKLEKSLPITNKILTIDNLNDLIETINNEYQREIQERAPFLKDKENLERRINKLDEIIEERLYGNSEEKKPNREQYHQALTERSEIRDSIRYMDEIIQQHTFIITYETVVGNEINSFNDYESVIRAIRNEKISQIKIRFYHRSLLKDLNVKLEHSQRCYGNYVSISGTNEEWVRSTYDLLKNKVNIWRNQFNYEKYKFATTICLFIIPALFSLILNSINPRNASIVEGFLVVLFFISFAIPVFIPSKISEIFPCIELQTGPAHLNIEEAKRNKIFWIVLSIVVPVAIAIITIFYPK